MLNLYLSFFNNCDSPRPWGLYFQDSATPQMEGLVELHDNIMFYLVIILFGVGWIMISIVRNYTNINSPISHKYLNHGTLIELIWTITPALILILIAFPSFKLLYLMDEVSDPAMSVLAEGFFFVFFLLSGMLCIEKDRIYGGLKSHILNKMKDTYKSILNIFIGEKRNILVSRPVQVKNTNVYNPFTSINIWYKIKHTSSMININHYYILKSKFHTKIRAINRIGPHNHDVISIIIGSLLGDGYANSRIIEGTRFSFKQSIIHKDYLFWLYKFFSDRGYCSNLAPRMYERLTNKGNTTLQEIKVYNGYVFNTFTFRSFNWIHKLFYKKGRKYINRDLAKYITPLALAIWIMDDGGWAKPGVRLSTNAFKLEDVQFLASILTNKWGLKCTVQKLSKSNQCSIYILGESLPILKKLVLPYIVPSMKYKLGLSIAKPNVK